MAVKVMLTAMVSCCASCNILHYFINVALLTLIVIWS